MNLTPDRYSFLLALFAPSVLIKWGACVSRPIRLVIRIDDLVSSKANITHNYFLILARRSIGRKKKHTTRLHRWVCTSKRHNLNWTLGYSISSWICSSFLQLAGSALLAHPMPSQRQAKVECWSGYRQIMIIIGDLRLWSSNRAKPYSKPFAQLRTPFSCYSAH